MDLLAPEILRIATIALVVITVLCFVVFLVIVVVRLVAAAAGRRRARFRRAAEPLVTRFLAGRASLDDTAAVLRRDPEEAMHLLMELAEHIGPGNRRKLHPLFSAVTTPSKLLSALKSVDWVTRMRAAEQLGHVGGDEAVRALATALGDHFLEVRLAAARSLVTLGSVEMVGRVLAAFDVPSEMSERRTAEILAGLGPSAIEPLLEVVKRPGEVSQSVLNVASRVLGALRASTAVPSLTGLLSHEAFTVRLNAVRALGAVGDRAALPAIAALAGDTSWEVRNAVVHAVGKLHAADHVELLTQALSDPSWWVRFSAAQALFSLGKPGIAALRAVVARPSDRYARDMCIQILEEHGLSLGEGAP